MVLKCRNVQGRYFSDGALREIKEEIGISLCKFNGKMIKSERRDVYNDFYDVYRQSYI